MVSKTDVQMPAGTDKAKLIAVVAIMLVAAVGFTYFSDQSLLLRVIALLIMLGFAGYLAMQTAFGVNTVVFFRDARTEVRKVVWPSRQETVQTTLTVFVIVFLVGLFLWFFDSILGYLFRLITGIGG